MKYYKQALTPVVVVSLLLIFTIASIISFQTWLASYNSKVFSDLDSVTYSSSDVEIQSIIGDTLYITSSQDGTSINTIIVGSMGCILNTSLVKGLNEFYIGNCLPLISTSTPDIVLELEDRIVRERIYVEELENSLCRDLSLLFHLNNDSSLGENNTHIVDSAGSLSNINCVNNNCSTFLSNSIINGGFDFDRSQNTYFIASESSQWNTFNDFTVSAWIKVPIDDVANDFYIASQSDKCGSTTSSWFFNLADDSGYLNELRFQVRANSTFEKVYSNVTLTDNSWHMVTGVRGNGNLSVYVDGLLTNTIVDGETGISFTPEGNFSIGGDPCESSEAFNGSIDEVVVWDRALSSKEIFNVYSLGQDLIC